MKIRDLAITILALGEMALTYDRIKKPKVDWIDSQAVFGQHLILQRQKEDRFRFEQYHEEVIFGLADDGKIVWKFHGLVDTPQRINPNPYKKY